MSSIVSIASFEPVINNFMICINEKKRKYNECIGPSNKKIKIEKRELKKWSETSENIVDIVIDFIKRLEILENKVQGQNKTIQAQNKTIQFLKKTNKILNEKVFKLEKRCEILEYENAKLKDENKILKEENNDLKYKK